MWGAEGGRTTILDMVHYPLTSVFTKPLMLVVPTLTAPRVSGGFLFLKFWSWQKASNLRPADYRSAALPTELCQLLNPGASLPAVLHPAFAYVACAVVSSTGARGNI